MKVALIGGTGQQGTGLAKRCAAAGLEVWLGSRDPARARAKADELMAELPGAKILGSDNVSAARQGDIVVLTIPHGSQPELVPPLREAVVGKVVVDTTVPMVPGRPPRVLQIQEGSSAEWVQQLLGPAVPVVSAFHTVSAHLLNRLERPLNVDTILCGNDPQAKRTVADLASRMGMRAVDGGGLEASHTLERMTVLLISMNMLYKKRTLGFCVANLT